MTCNYCLKEQEKRICDACGRRMSRFFGLVHKLTEYKPLPPMRIPHLGMERSKKDSGSWKGVREKRNLPKSLSTRDTALL